jgi:hypothetical protein
MVDYTVPPLQFLIGGFDASQYLDSISLSVPMHEPGQPLLWTGRFKLSNNLKARANGLTDNDFSEYGTPSRWRPYQQQVRLDIRGISSPVFRIENYRYNPQTSSGEGMLTQIPTAVAGDRPGTLVETTVSGNIGTAIERLLTASFLGATVQPGRALVGDGGVLDVPLTTRNPWSDACRLTGLSWNWLAVNGAESIVTVAGSNSNLVFSRTAEQVELVPDLAAIYQSAQKVIVTGARQVTDTSAANPSATSQTPTAPRPKFKATSENRPAGTVFPAQAPSTSPIVFEEKTIIYQYWDDDSWSNYLPSGVFLTSFLYDIQSQTQTGINPYGAKPVDLNVPLQTITIKRQPRGYLFPSLAPDASLITAEVIVESNLRKLTIKPVGVLFSAQAPDATLTIEKRESLTTQLIPPGTQIVAPAVNPNGTAQQFEPRPKLEAQQPIATRPLKTEVLKGEAQLSPLGWVPILAKPLVVDFGFLPDNARATMLANKIAVREQQRRDQVLVDMPIPTEWLANGWPLLSQAIVGGNTYLMDGCALSIADGIAKFGFTGALVSRGSSVDVGGVPTLVQQSQYQVMIELESAIAFEAEMTSAVAAAIEPSIAFEMQLSSGVRVDLEPSIVFDGSISSAGGTMLAPEMVFEPFVSTGAGIVLDAGIIFDAIVTMGILQRLTFTVSPSSQLEGSPVVQTLTFTVSPSSQLEGSPVVQTLTFTVSPSSQLEG